MFKIIFICKLTINLHQLNFLLLRKFWVNFAYKNKNQNFGKCFHSFYKKLKNLFKHNLWYKHNNDFNVMVYIFFYQLFLFLCLKYLHFFNLNFLIRLASIFYLSIHFYLFNLHFNKAFIKHSLSCIISFKVLSGFKDLIQFIKSASSERGCLQY